MPRSMISHGPHKCNASWRYLRKRNAKGHAKLRQGVSQAAGQALWLFKGTCQWPCQVMPRSTISHGPHKCNAKRHAKYCQGACQALGPLRHNANGHAKQYQGACHVTARGMAFQEHMQKRYAKPYGKLSIMPRGMPNNDMGHDVPWAS